MKEDYALSLLKREQQALFIDTQLQGYGPGILIDPRIARLKSLGNAINLLERFEFGNIEQL